MKKEEIESCLDRLLKNSKPKIIAFSFKDKNDFSEEQIKHFKTAEYLWNTHPHDKDDKYKGMYMGVLLDDNLNYVHMVFATNEMVNYIFNL